MMEAGRQRAGAAPLRRNRCNSLACTAVFRRVLLRLLRTLLAADGDFPVAELELNAAVFDFPVTDRTRCRIHAQPFQAKERTKPSPRSSGAEVRAGMVEGWEPSNFQNLAQLAPRRLTKRRTSDGVWPNSRRKTSVK